jgi:hypothetical protein
MPIELSISAIALATIAPLLAATAVFFASLGSWIEHHMRSDPAMQQRLRLTICDGRVAWLFADAAAPRPWPHAPLIGAALAGIAVALGETLLFASGSAVPSLWYQSGAAAAGIALVAPYILTGLFRTALHRSIDRRMMQHAHDDLAAVEPALEAIGDIARQIDEGYAAMGLRGRTDAWALCSESLLVHAGHGSAATVTDLVRIRNRLEHDLRHVQYCGYLFASALSDLAQAKDALQGQEGMRDAIAQVESWIRAPELTDLLEQARWPEAGERLETIRDNLRRLLDMALQDCAMPRSVEDAYRVLNVTDDTPLSKIKGVVSAFQRVWHPDLARDETERQRSTSKMQQINAAWEFIRKARVSEETSEQ